MYKSASPARSVADFAKALKKGGIKGDINKIVDEAILPDNSGSMILDFLSRGRLKDSQTLRNIQRKSADIDMKLGGKVYDFFDSKNNKFVNKMKNSFVDQNDILKARGTDGSPDTYLRVQRAGLLNPINKVKGKALPFVGSITVANHLLNKEDKQHE